MGAFDRQLVNALDNLHKDLMGGRAENHCQWFYNAKSDIYHCPHTAVYGKDLMERIPAFQDLNSETNTEAWLQRDQEHKL